MEDKDWLEKYSLAKKYYEENGNLLIKKTYKVRDINLGRWISVQRKNNKLGKLSSRRKELLDEIDMIWNCSDASWFKMYKEAVNYYKEKGNLKVPNEYSYIKEDEEINLGNWIVDQRFNYNNGKLSSKRKELLDEIGMVWKLRARLSWEYMFELAKDYYLKNNKLFSSTYKVNIDGNDILLGSWLNNQKKFYNEGKLSQERIKLLETIGLKWTKEERKQTRENNENRKWLILYKAVLNYYKEHGDLVLPKDFKVKVEENDILLGEWLERQKGLINKKKLTPEKEELINALFSLDEDNKIKTKNDKKWYDLYNLAKEYYNHSGNIEIPSEYEVIVNGKVKKLGQWLNLQRKSYKKGKLSEERINLLNELGMIWEFGSIRHSEWLDNYELAKKYYLEHGNININKKYFVDGFCLGAWLYRQKVKYSENKLTSEQIDMLEKIGVDWNLSANKMIKEQQNYERWLRIYNEIKVYYEKYGNLDIPLTYEVSIDNKLVNLKRWLNTQKVQYEFEKLTEEKINLLNEIGIVWNSTKVLKK